MQPEPLAPHDSAAERAGIVRYVHPEKTPALRRLGTPAVDVLPITAFFARTDVPTVEDLRKGFSAEVHRRAKGMLQDPTFAKQVRALPFGAGDVIVALGDSITDDALSWAHLLQDVLDQSRPQERIVVSNHGITGHTTAEVISRLDTVIREDPSWVIQLIGTNDARWHGGSTAVQTASLPESIRNLRAIRAVIEAETTARYVTMTPPPVDDEATRRWPSFQEQQIAWRNEDVLRLADVLRQDGADPVDLYTAFASRGLAGILQGDGVHPTEDGQQLILRLLVEHLVGSGARPPA